MFTGHYGVFTSFPCSGETLQYLEIVGKSYHYPGVSPQSVNITGFIHNIHRVSLWFLHPFSIDSAGFLCRDPVIPWHPKILADQLTLYQPRGTNYAHRVIQIFRPSYGPGYFFFFIFLMIISSIDPRYHCSFWISYYSTRISYWPKNFFFAHKKLKKTTLKSCSEFLKSLLPWLPKRPKQKNSCSKMCPID